jgi:hypothetical protein
VLWRAHIPDFELVPISPGGGLHAISGTRPAARSMRRGWAVVIRHLSEGNVQDKDGVVAQFRSGFGSAEEQEFLQQPSSGPGDL